jgi:hypothetical protein
MPIFAEAFALVKSVEIHLVSETKSEIRLFGCLKRHVCLPAKFIKMGMCEKAKGASVWAILSFAFMMLGAWLVKNSGIAKTDAADMVMFASMIIPLFLVVFALPSTYGDSGVSPRTIQFVLELLHARGFSCAKDVELLKKSVKPFEERSRSRVSALKWLVGLLWAGFTYAISKGIDASMSTPSYVFMLAWLFMVIIVTYLCVWGYEASLDKLFRAIEFGCNDFCHLIELPSPFGAHPAVKSENALRRQTESVAAASNAGGANRSV